jgi:hypothetical protein
MADSSALRATPISGILKLSIDSYFPHGLEDTNESTVPDASFNFAIWTFPEGVRNSTDGYTDTEGAQNHREQKHREQKHRVRPGRTEIQGELRPLPQPTRFVVSA